MSLQHAKTIEIFLPTGDPRGLRLANIRTRTVKAIEAPRNQLDQLFKREEAQRPACYFLIGEPDAPENEGKVYIGETETVPQRLKDHNDTKDFWSKVVIVVSATNDFTKAHIKYLEWLSIAAVRKAGRYEIENKNDSSKPHAPEAVKADILDAFENTGVLLATLGFPVFEPRLAATSKTDEAAQTEGDAALGQRLVFTCSSRKGVKASGEWTQDGFILHAGSLVARDVVKSLQSYVGYMRKRHRYVEDGLLVSDDGGHYRLTKDLTLPSPSAASDLVLGSSSNGWDMWIAEDGRTLDQVYRRKLDEPGIAPEIEGI